MRLTVPAPRPRGRAAERGGMSKGTGERCADASKEFWDILVAMPMDHVATLLKGVGLLVELATRFAEEVAKLQSHGTAVTVADSTHDIERAGETLVTVESARATRTPSGIAIRVVAIVTDAAMDIRVSRGSDMPGV